MTKNEVFLKLFQIAGADADVAEFAESGCNTVHRFIAPDPLIDQLTGGLDIALCFRRNTYPRRSRSNVIDYRDGERIAVETVGGHRKFGLSFNVVGTVQKFN